MEQFVADEFVADGRAAAAEETVEPEAIAT
jgi:hypothetical protein